VNAAASAAVAADSCAGFEHHRFLRQPLINWGQLPALDQLGQHGRFFECLGHSGGVGDDGAPSSFAHQLTEIGLGRWLRRRSGRLGSPRLPVEPARLRALMSASCWFGRLAGSSRRGGRRLRRRYWVPTRCTPPALNDAPAPNPVVRVFAA